MASKSNKKTPLTKNVVPENVADDDDEEVEEMPVKSSFQAKFSMLASDDDADDADDNDDENEEESNAPAKPTATSSASSKKKGAKKKGAGGKGKKTEEDDIDNILAAIESTSVSSKKSAGNKKNKTTTGATTNDDAYKENEGQDLETILKEIDEQFDEKDRKKQAKKDKKKKKKDEVVTGPPAEIETAVTEAKPKENEVVEEKNPVEQAEATKTGAIAEDETTGVDDKKGSSKSKKKKEAEKKGKGGVDAKTLSLMKEYQRLQEEAKSKALKDEEERIRFEEELATKREEQLRLEKEQREKKKLKEKERIRRKKEEGSYLTKEQREKLERARVQLEAAGVQVPARNATQKGTTNEETVGQQTKKRVIYDDRRKKGKGGAQQGTTDASTAATPVGSTKEFAEKSNAGKKEELKDDWDQESEEETTNIQDESQTTSAENGRNVAEMKEETQSTTTKTEDQNASSESDSENDETSSDESEEWTSSDDDDADSNLTSIERVRRRFQRRHVVYEGRRSKEVLRAPVICVLGHVDTGKTKILDNLRRSNVQDNEVGGITQQIGATNVPLETIRERTKMCRKMISREGDFIVPGLLIIDTPGHESFKNLRSRGSSLCDLAILVVDLMHGIEPQTLESIQLLTDRKTPFVIALNKIDRLYNWKGDNKRNIEVVIEEQSQNTRNEFEKRCNDIFVQFAEKGLNVALYYKNPDPNEFYSMIPTSAHTGDGMGSLIAMIIEKCQTTLAQRLSYSDELQATVMEVKAIGGLGTTIDVALVNGRLRVGDSIIVAGQEGPIVTQVRGLLMPQPNKELRVRNQYQNYKEVKGARGIKIAARDLEKAMAGLPLFVGRKDDEIEYYKNEIQTILKSALSSIKLKENGVHVQASTLGSLEALLEFLKTSNIPYSGINIGPVHRRDVIRASTQLEREPQWAVLLAFDVRIERDAQEHADSVGVKIFQADIIYHLFDMFIAHRERLKKENQEKFRHVAVFPCKLRVLPQYIFNSRDPIVCGVIVEDGFVRLGTPICVPSKESIDLGRIVSIELNHKPIETARKGAEVCIKIEPVSGEAPKMYGRHFDQTDLLMSKITRESIDAVKDHFRDDMQKTDWQLMIELKKIFNIL